MSNKTRKYIWPVSLAMSLALIGALAALVAFGTVGPQPAVAHGPCGDLLSEDPRTSELEAFSDCVDDGGDLTHNHGPDVVAPSAMSAALMGETGSVESSSTSGSATVQIDLQIDDLRMAVPVGGSIVLYLEDDFQEPDSISASDVYFVSRPSELLTGYSSRVYATVNPEMDSDGYFTADKSDISIRVLVPDMCTNATERCEGDNGLIAGHDVTVVIQKSAGIKNPSEAGGHSTGYDVLDSTGDVRSGMDNPDHRRGGRVRCDQCFAYLRQDQPVRRGQQPRLRADG